MEGSIEPQDTKNINRPVAPPRRKKSKVPSINVSPHNDSTAVPASSSPDIGPASPPHVVDTSRSTSPGSPVLPKRPPAPRPRSKISVSNSRQESSLNTSIGSDSNARSQPEAVLSDGRKVSTAGGRHPKLKRQISGPKPVITPRVMTSARTDIKGQNEGEPQTVSLTSFAANTKRPDRKAFTMNNKSSTSSYSTSEEELSPNKESSSLSSVPSVKKDQRTVSVELQKSSVSSFCTMPRRLTNDKQRSGHKTTSSVKKDKEDKSPERSSTTVIYTKGNRKSYVSVNHSKPNQYQHAPVHRDTLADSYTHEPKVDRAKKKGTDSPVLKSRPTRATNSPKTSLSRQNKVTDTPEVHRKQSKYPPRVNTNVHQQTRPPKDPYINLSQGKKKPLGRGVKPVRPAPPPPNMIAHYAQFKPHSVPSEKTFPEDDTYSYVLVTPRYRLEQPGSRNLQSLNLEVNPRQRVNSFDTYGECVSECVSVSMCLWGGGGGG